MYNENSNFSIKNVIIQFLFVALFVFILIWLFPLKSDLNKLKGTADNSINNKDLSVLVDRIFNENIIAMKDAAKSYYTTERLPQNVGDKVKMTLGEMLDKKIILPFTDKNGDACDLEASYVEVTKYDTEFLMKVNLKCGEEENYLLVYMGCYDYCSTAVCEKNKSDIKAPVIYSAKTNKPVTAKSTTTKTTTPSNPTKVTPKCEYADGKYYDNNGNVVSKSVYDSKCTTPTPTENPKCQYVNGKYYDNSGNVVSKSVYDKRCSQPEPTENPKCQYVNGKYYDNSGNVVSKSVYDSKCTTPVTPVTYLYEYSKTTAGTCTESNWSEWSTTKVTADANTAVQTKKVTTKKLIGYNVKKGYDYDKPIYGTKTVETGYYENRQVCQSYGYVQVGSSNTTTTTSNSTSGSGWTYVGTESFSYTPTNTSTDQYILVGENSSICKENCTATTTKTYKHYTRSAGSTSTSSSTSSTPITEYQCTSYKTVSVPITTTVKTITGYETKVISKTPVYQETTTTYYRYKKRTCTSTTISKKWSTYNNTTLLNSGYSYTGNKKQK